MLRSHIDTHIYFLRYRKIWQTEGDYVKVIAFRLKFERDEVLFAKLRKKYPASYKFMNETNHIENDYVFQLDPLKFYSIPEFYLNELKKCIQEN